jgi:hypothetical protein
MTRHSSFWFAIPAIATALAAQGETVSPFSATYTEANSNNTIPWWSQTHRYQQIHNNTRGKVMILRGISWRRDGSFGGPARTVDTEIFVGTGDYATATTTFATNYTNTPVRVLNRKMVSLPDHSAPPPTSPAPWTVVIPFDTPWPYVGQADLLWDMYIYSTTSSASYPLDAYSGSGVTLVNGSSQKLGTGCTATGQAGEMTVTANLQTSGSASTTTFGWSVTRGRASSPVALMLGMANPDVQIPGICTKLYTSAQINLVGMTDSGGNFNIPATTLPYNPVWAGVHLFSQAVCADAGQAGLPYAASHGLDTVIPDTPPLFMRVWANDVNAVSGSRETYPYGLVTRFLHQ